MTTAGPPVRPDTLGSDEVAVGQPLLPDAELFEGLSRTVWSSRWLTNSGPVHERLEGELARVLETPTTVLTSSGTTALMLALALQGLPRGSEVITTPGTFAATVGALDWMGLTPVFADVDPSTWCLDPAAVAAAMTPRTSAILGVHLFGTLCDDSALADVAGRHGVPLLYDAAHAWGAQVDGVPVGSLGAASAFSLHATKLMHTGEGGVVTTPRPDDRDPLERLRNFGLVTGRPLGPGINGKMPETSAVLGLAVLHRVPEETEARRRLRRRLDEIVDSSPTLGRQPDQPGVLRSEIFYALRVHGDGRDELARRLVSGGVHPRLSFPLLCGPGSAHPDERIVTAGTHPVAPAIADEVLCLPFHSRVTDRHVEVIAEAVAAL